MISVKESVGGVCEICMEHSFMLLTAKLTQLEKRPRTLLRACDDCLWDLYQALKTWSQP